MIGLGLEPTLIERASVRSPVKRHGVNARPSVARWGRAELAVDEAALVRAAAFSARSDARMTLC